MNVQCTVFCCQLDNFLIDAAASYGEYANSDISSVWKRIQILFARSNPVLIYLNVMHYVFAVKLTILGCMLLQLVVNMAIQISDLWSVKGHPWTSNLYIEVLWGGDFKQTSKAFDLVLFICSVKP